MFRRPQTPGADPGTSQERGTSEPAQLYSSTGLLTLSVTERLLLQRPVGRSVRLSSVNLYTWRRGESWWRSESGIVVEKIPERVAGGQSRVVPTFLPVGRCRSALLLVLERKPAAEELFS